MIPVPLRRAVLRTAAIVLFATLAGATYQGAATAIERRQFPHPGRMIDIGGLQLHIYCTGNGSPTVVLEAPAAGMSAAWGWVQPAVAQTTRVCSYDRAGLGWSEAGDQPYDPSAVPDQLLTLLSRAGERGPYVLVGHGLGGIFVKLFAARFPTDALALILIDPATTGSPSPPTIRLVRASPWLARAGILRVTRVLSDTVVGLPESSAGPMMSFLNRPDHLSRTASEMARWNDAVHLADTAPLSPSVRVIQVSANRRERVEFLTDSSRAAEVTDAITSAISRAASAW